jgi:hypothetical protein
MTSNIGQAQNSEDDARSVSRAELASSENNPIDRYLTAITVVSTTASTRAIDFSGSNLYLENDIDDPVQVGDKIDITGTSGGAADGRFTVESITDDDTLVVVETIADSTGGAADFIHQSGCARVGYTGAIPNQTDVCGAVDSAYVNGATSIPPMYISDSPSSAPTPFGYRDKAYGPPKLVRIAGLFLYTLKTGGGAKTMRARIFKWDGTLGTSILLFKVEVNITGADDDFDLSRTLLASPGDDVIDATLGDRVYGRIDDGTGPDNVDNSGAQPDPKFAQINYIPETGAV